MMNVYERVLQQAWENSRRNNQVAAQWDTADFIAETRREMAERDFMAAQLAEVAQFKAEARDFRFRKIAIIAALSTPIVLAVAKLIVL